MDTMLARDLEALRRTTREGMPVLEAQVAAVRGRGGAAVARRRTRLRGMALAVVAALCLLAFPVRYERRAGSEVRLTLADPEATDLRVLAEEFTRALGAAPDRAAPAGEGLWVFVPGVDPAVATRRAGAFVGALAARGVTARATVSPRAEWSWGPLAALARERMVRLRLEPRQAPGAIERDVRAQLRAQGIDSAAIVVAASGGLTVVQILGPQPPGAQDGVDVRLARTGARVSRIRAPSLRDRSDEEIRLELEHLLREHGFDIQVEVHHGRIVSVRDRRRP